MARARSVYRCAQCGHDHPKWVGRCEACGEWNTVAEEPMLAARRPDARTQRRKDAKGSAPRPLADVEEARLVRWTTGIPEFDRVLGGGIVPGSMALIGGEPGIGKSTLLLQVAHLLARMGGAVLYVSGEESERQIKLRGERLGISGGALFLMGETCLERILEQVEELKPAALVVDSVQTVYSSKFSSAPGTIS